MRLIKGLMVLAVLTALVMLVAPTGGKWYLKYRLQQKGFSPTIKHLSVNYFLGRVVASGVTLRKDNTEYLSIFALELDLDVSRILQGELAFDKIVSDNLQLAVNKKDDRWQLGGLTIDQWLGARDQRRVVSVKRLEAVNSDICTPDKNQCLRVEQLNAGALAWHREAGQWSFSQNAPMSVSKVFLQDRTNSASVFYLDSLSVVRSDFSETATVVQGLDLKNFQLIESQRQPGGKSVTPFQTQIGELTLESALLQFGPAPLIRLNGIRVISYRQAIQRSAASSNWYKRAEHWFPNTVRLWRDVDFSSASGTEFELTNFFAQGGRLVWRDNSVAPPVIENLNQIKLTVDRIDSDTAAPTHLLFEAKLGDIGALKFDSKAQFFAGAPLFDVTGYAHGIDLANFAGYTADIFNQRVKAGVIDLSFNVGASQGHIAGQSVWRITGLATEASQATLNTSFRKLADHNNSVEFDLPIGLATGVDAKPWQALGRAVVNTLNNKARQSTTKTGNEPLEPQGQQQALAPAVLPAS